MKANTDACRNGHPKTKESVYVHPRTGVTACRICQSNSQIACRDRIKKLIARSKERLAEVKPE